MDVPGAASPGFRGARVWSSLVARPGTWKQALLSPRSGQGFLSRQQRPVNARGPLHQEASTAWGHTSVPTPPDGLGRRVEVAQVSSLTKKCQFSLGEGENVCMWPATPGSRKRWALQE